MKGMHFSLVSREVIADSVETVMMAERLDGSVLLAGCDKSLPGMPSASATLAMVLAVYMPLEAPSPGQIAFSMRVDLGSVVILPARQAPTASKASMMVTSFRPPEPGIVDPAYRKMHARSRRAAASAPR